MSSSRRYPHRGRVMVRSAGLSWLPLAAVVVAGGLSGCGLGGASFSIGPRDTPRLTFSGPQDCVITYRCDDGGRGKFPGMTVTARIQAPDSIACHPTEETLRLDAAGRVEWRVEMRLTRKYPEAGTERVRVVFEHESVFRNEHAFDVDVGP